jgi:hypothetical protein
VQIQTRTVADYRQDDQRWLGNGGEPAQVPSSIVLDKSAFTATFDDGYIPSGVVVGKITATGLYAPYNNANANGTEVAAGLIFAAVPYDVNGAAGDDLGAALMYAGEVLEEFLPTGHGLDANARTDLKLIRFVAA